MTALPDYYAEERLALRRARLRQRLRSLLAVLALLGLPR